MKGLSILLFIFLKIPCIGQSTPDPVIGEPFPNYSFNDIHNFKTQSFSIEDAKGRWLILDFWNELCAACIRSFPENTEINRRFSDKVVFVSVGYTGSMEKGKSSNLSIRSLYQRITNKYRFDFPIAYDSVLYDKFEVGRAGCPYIVVIDPNGIVRQITGKLHKEDVENLISGRPVDLPLIDRLKVYQKSSAARDFDSLLIYSSTISSWDKGRNRGLLAPYLFHDTDLTDKFRMVGMPLLFFYHFAYLGATNWDSESQLYSNFSYYPIFELQDSSLFDRSLLFTYQLKSPKMITKKEVMMSLQNSLYNAFGLKVRIEKRQRPYWKLTIIDSMKIRLQTKGGSTKFVTSEFLGFTGINIPFSYIVAALAAQFDLYSIKGLGYHYYDGRPFIDESNFKGNIDIKIDAFMEDFDEVRKAFLEKGIQITEGYKKMDCLVISNN